MPNSQENKDRLAKERLIKYDAEVVQPIRKQKLERLEHVKPASLEAQVAFVKELMKSPEETDKFLEDPKTYSVEHGILFSPEVVQAITNTVLFDTMLDENEIAKLGKNTLQDIIDMREGKATGVRSNVVAAAAVVMAVAAVVTAVVTVVRTKHPEDLIGLQGLGEQGTLLPNGQSYIGRDY